METRMVRDVTEFFETLKRWDRIGRMGRLVGIGALGGFRGRCGLGAGGGLVFVRCLGAAGRWRGGGWNGSLFT